MSAADVVEILGCLDAASADVWLDGGWGVDALVGEQTREHEDLDLIVRDAHESRMREVLATTGLSRSKGASRRTSYWLMNADAKWMFIPFVSITRAAVIY
jgi:Aminoglycoside-2''-adenylyltransferase